jgi:D-xylose transport system substrate-binding protein
MKRMKKYTALILALAMILLLAACSSPAATSAPTTSAPTTSAQSAAQTGSTAAASGAAQSSAPAAGSDEIFVGFSLPTQSIERWVKDGENMKALCDKEGIKLVTQIANDDAGKQIAQCENLIAQGVDVLVIAPHDAEAAATIVEKAHAENIPVISYDRLILNAEVDYYVSFDSVEVGRLQGKYALEHAPEGNYVILSGDAADNNAKLFKQGAMEMLDPAIQSGKIKVVADQAVKGWDPANALRIVEDALTNNDNNIAAIVCPNDGTAGAAVEALTVQGLAGKVVVTGGDCDSVAVKRIYDGTQSMTVLKDINLLAEATVKAVKQIKAGETVEVKLHGQQRPAGCPHGYDSAGGYHRRQHSEPPDRHGTASEGCLGADTRSVFGGRGPGSPPRFLEVK